MALVKACFRCTLWGLAAVTGVAVLAALAVAVRLALGPMVVPWVTPRLAQTLDDALPGWQVDVDRTVLSYRDGLAGLALDRVTLVAPGDGQVLRLPRVGMTLRIAPLLAGRAEVERIELVNAAVDILWSAARLTAPADARPTDAGSSDAGATGGGSTGPSGREPTQAARLPALTSPQGRGDSGQAVLALIRDLADLDPLNGAMPSLDRVRIRNAAIRLLEQGSGAAWHITVDRADLSRRGARLTARVAGEVRPAVADRATPFSLSAGLAVGAGLRDLDVTVRRFRPDRFAAGIPELAGLAGVAVPVALAARLDLADDAPPDLRLTAEGGPGRMAIAGLYDTPLPVAHVRLRARLTPGLLALDEAALRFAGTDLSLSGRVRAPLSDRPGVSLKGAFTRLSVADLVRYWPAGLAAGGRDWIAENISAGHVTDAALSVAIPRAAWDAAALPADALGLDFGYEGLVTTYIDGLPPAEAISGRGRLTARDLDLSLDTARIDGRDLSGSHVYLYDFDAPIERARINLRTDADLGSVLDLVDRQPLGYPSEMGIDPAQVSGRAQTRAELAFPLLSDLLIDDVQVVVGADLSDVHLPLMAADGALDDGDLSLRVTNTELTLEGTGRVRGLPLDLAWHEDFDPAPGAPTTRYDLAGALTGEALAGLGLSVDGAFEGSAPFTARLTGAEGGVSAGDLEVVLTPASLTLDPLNWAKPVGVPARATARFTLPPEGGITVERLALTGWTLNAAASLRLGPEGRLERLSLDYLRSRDQDLSARFGRSGDGAPWLELTGRRIDLRGVLPRGVPDTESRAPNGAADGLPARLDVALAADRVLVANAMSFIDLTVAAHRDAGLWTVADIGFTAGEGPARVVLSPLPDARRQVHLDAADTGALLRGLGLFANVLGGRLQGKATLRRQAGQTLAEGEVTVRDFRLLRTETLAERIDTGTAGDLSDLVGPDGLRFKRLVLPFRADPTVIDFSKVIANGPRLGLTMEGEVARDMSRLNVNGTLVPLYRLNAILNRIPLVGDFLLGGEGKGLFALNYRISGPMDDPEVSINQLSVLAPGLLRRLMDGPKGRIDDLEAAEDAPPPAAQTEQAAPPNAAPPKTSPAEPPSEPQSEPEPPHPSVATPDADAGDPDAPAQGPPADPPGAEPPSGDAAPGEPGSADAAKPSIPPDDGVETAPGAEPRAAPDPDAPAAAGHGAR
ncbi:hypothetical protein CCR85_08945 [Rhodothalassium salexigens]|uniref:YhdP family protein n=1 Tax=Rhodothalassium salexigens TaxID=1086 RepID=UPI0019113648|nr:AsmA-like C-terminal domain-containing protein [Rhodothalassium salexigens]MBK5911614.1 hypothetical protein [Rhodothalassium salexigens]